MLIKFKHLVVENFLSLGNIELDLNDRGYTLVNGINNNPNDNAQSNGSGKCFGAGTKILMWDGTSKKVEDIKPYDIVMGWDSTPRIVLETHRGFGELYEVRSSRDTAVKNYTYICNENHILCLRRSQNKHIDAAKTHKEPYPEYDEISIKDYLNKGYNYKSGYTQYISEGIDKFYHSPYNKGLKIPPYILGAWLGDGNKESPAITTMDEEIKIAWYNWAKELGLNVTITSNGSKAFNYHIVYGKGPGANKQNTALNYILEYNLRNNKHIPLEYLTAPKEQRLELLAGLLDTDGSLIKNICRGKKKNVTFHYEITQVNEFLIDQILFLARSLGFRAIKSKSSARYLARGIDRQCYTVNISGDIWNIPVKIARKKSPIFERKLINIHNIHPYIKHIGKGNYYGFQISGDGKFLLEDCTVVHNSSLFDAICFCLCNETIRGVKNNLVNIHSTGGMKVELDFEVDGNSYKIIRSKDYKELGTTVKLYVNGIDKSGKGVRDTEKIISEYLPDLTSELIGSVIILGQGMPQKFTDNTPSGRKEVLEKLSKSDFMIEDIKNRLNNRKSILLKELRDIELKINTSQSQLNIYEKQLPQFEKQLEELTIPNINEINKINAKVNQLNEELKELSPQLQ